MSEISGRIEAVLERRRLRLPVVDVEIARWRRLGETIARLGAAVAEAEVEDGDGDAVPRLAGVDVSDMAVRAAASLAALQVVRSRVSRSTVNIGVSGQARNGKSTLLQSLSGLSDQQIPSGRGRPVTAVRSRIFHSADTRAARLTMHTEHSFHEEVLRPYYEEFQPLPAPATYAEFAAQPDALPAGTPTGDLERDPRLGPLLARLREMHAATATYRRHLTGGVETVDLEKLRDWVAYPADDDPRQDRRYLAVREAVIHCDFLDDDVVALGLIDLPGLGELTPKAEERHLAGLHNDVDFVLVVKWPTDTNSLWTTSDAAGLELINRARSAAAMRDFAAILVNTGECLPSNVEALHADLTERVNNKIPNGHYRVLEADVADRGQVRERVLGDVLAHLAEALPRMDSAVVDGAMATCAANLEALRGSVSAALTALRSVLTPTPYEELFARAEALRAELALSLQSWVSELYAQASDGTADQDFHQRTEEVQTQIRAWVVDGFGQGVEQWQREAVDRFRTERASRPHASLVLNAARVEIARRFGAVDDVLLARRDAFWAGLVRALGPRFGALLDDDPTADPRDALLTLLARLRDAPEPCPNLVEVFEFVLDVRLDFRTLVLPRLRETLMLLYPEPPGDRGVRMASLTGVSHDEAGAALLFDRLSQLARQGVHDAGSVLGGIPGIAARVLLAFAEQFEDVVVRGAHSRAELARVADAFRDQMWPEADTGPARVTAQVQRVRSVLSELHHELADARREAA